MDASDVRDILGFVVFHRSFLMAKDMRCMHLQQKVGSVLGDVSTRTGLRLCRLDDFPLQ